MKPEYLQKLTEICSDFKRFRDNTTDGKGNNLHDVKTTFDYVSKTIEQYQLTGTQFGSNLVEKANQAGKVLIQLETCLQDLERSLTNFIDNQTKTNNQNAGEAGKQVSETMASIDYSALNNLKNMDLSGLQNLKNLDLSSLQNLKNLDLSGLQNLKNLDLSSLQNLKF